MIYPTSTILVSLVQHHLVSVLYMSKEVQHCHTNCTSTHMRSWNLELCQLASIYLLLLRVVSCLLLYARSLHSKRWRCTHSHHREKHHCARMRHDDSRLINVIFNLNSLLNYLPFAEQNDPPSRPLLKKIWSRTQNEHRLTTHAESMTLQWWRILRCTPFILDFGKIKYAMHKTKLTHFRRRLSLRHRLAWVRGGAVHRQKVSMSTRSACGRATIISAFWVFAVLCWCQV